MPPEASGKDILENAYKLSTPGDNAAYYDAFAPTYDSDFVAQMGYQYPKAIAKAYHRHAADGDTPLVDIGCGTGIVATELALQGVAIDGMDISAEMLGVAGQKSHYRALYNVDLTGPLDAFANTYGAVLSAGTFTHGHLGPDPLRGLLQIARPGALFIIGVNQHHFEAQGFARVLDAMVASGAITPVAATAIDIYSKQGHDHSNDRALILQYRKI
jgi:predicted TPR repeat methyltransferase